MSADDKQFNSVNEFVIEWVKGDSVATVTFPAHHRLNTRVQKLAESFDEVEYIMNADGSICGHIPTSWIKINPPKQLTEEQKQQLAERIKNIRANKDDK